MRRILLRTIFLLGFIIISTSCEREVVDLSNLKGTSWECTSVVPKDPRVTVFLSRELPVADRIDFYDDVVRLTYGEYEEIRWYSFHESYLYIEPKLYGTSYYIMNKVTFIDHNAIRLDCLGQDDSNYYPMSSNGYSEFRRIH